MMCILIATLGKKGSDEAEEGMLLKLWNIRLKGSGQHDIYVRGERNMGGRYLKLYYTYVCLALGKTFACNDDPGSSIVA